MPWLLTLIEEQPDLTLDEVVSAMHKYGIGGTRTAVWSFFERHNISFKKSLRAAEQDRPDVARARRCWKRRQAMLNSTRLVFIDETAANTRMVRLSGRCPRGERLVGCVPQGQNPIEMPFSKLKANLRKAAERTVPRLCRRIGSFARRLSAAEALNYFRHAGYA